MGYGGMPRKKKDDIDWDNLDGGCYAHVCTAQSARNARARAGTPPARTGPGAAPAAAPGPAPACVLPVGCTMCTMLVFAVAEPQCASLALGARATSEIVPALVFSART